MSFNDDVIKWKHFSRCWPFVRGIHRSPLNSLHKGQWRVALIFSLICAWKKRLNKQSWGWWFQKPSHPLWRHCNAQRPYVTPVSCFQNSNGKHYSELCFRWPFRSHLNIFSNLTGAMFTIMQLKIFSGRGAQWFIETIYPQEEYFSVLSVIIALGWWSHWIHLVLTLD